MALVCPSVALNIRGSCDGGVTTVGRELLNLSVVGGMPPVVRRLSGVRGAGKAGPPTISGTGGRGVPACRGATCGGRTAACAAATASGTAGGGPSAACPPGRGMRRGWGGSWMFTRRAGWASRRGMAAPFSSTTGRLSRRTSHHAGSFVAPMPLTRHGGFRASGGPRGRAWGTSNGSSGTMTGGAMAWMACSMAAISAGWSGGPCTQLKPHCGYLTPQM